ncbi:MAG: DNRLRE domain-containing protein [Paenibacillaceae bacterium]|nr:DNRLRE domain-containing protein [Paenibacillaceae bacterium]
MRVSFRNKAASKTGAGLLLVLTLWIVMASWSGPPALQNRAAAAGTDPVNLAAASLGTVAAASSVSSDRPPANANDGDPASMWGPLSADKNDGTVWLALNFGAAKAFDRLTLDFVAPSGSAALPTAYTIYRLNDAAFTGTYDDNPAKWTAVASRALSDYSAAAADDVAFAKVTAKRLTVVFTTDPGNPIPRVEEIGVYEATRTLASVSVHAARLSANPGQTVAVEATGRMTDGGLAPLTGATFVWSSASGGIVSVASSGSALSTATAVAAGTAVLTGQVTLNGVTQSGTLSIQVKSPGTADVYDTLREKYRDRQTGGAYNPADPDIAAAIALIEADARPFFDTYHTPTAGEPYLWADVLPTAGASLLDKYIFAAEDSYNRLLKIARAYAIPETGFTPAERTLMRSRILEGMTFLQANWYNTASQQDKQWYKFEIGVPKAILSLTVLMNDDLQTAGKSALIANQLNAINHFSPDPKDSRSASSTDTPRIGYMTGANLVEKCYNEALVGILRKSSASLELARSSLYSVFDYVTDGDGFYRDGSFVQHDTVAYTGSYGLVLIGALPEYMELMNGTSWDIANTGATGYRDVTVLYDWVRESFEPVYYRGLMMDMVRGRAISRGLSQDLDAGRSFLLGLPTIAAFAPPGDAAEMKGLVKKWAGSSIYDGFFAGVSIYGIAKVKAILNDSGLAEWDVPAQHKQFPSMDRIVHRRPGFTFALSLYSSRISNYEYQAAPNEENVRGWYTGEGMTYLYNDDVRQYSDGFWPTVDAKRLPGITVDYGQNRTAGSGNKYESPESWVGGTEIGGLYGSAGMQVDGWNNTLAAKKSWFMFDDEIVALGAGISSTDNRTIETIVDNRRLNATGSNALTVNGTVKSTSLPWSETMSSVNWAHLAGSTAGSDIGYYFPGGAAIKGLREARTGAWTDINPYHTEANLGDPLTRNYLSLRFDHGANPANGTYSYVLLPDKTAAQVSAYAGSPDVSVVANTVNVQAVRESALGIFAANFWKDGTYTAGSVTSNKKAAVMTRLSGGVFEVSVSDPTQSNTGTIVVDIDQAVSGVIAKDARVTVVQTSPTLKLSIDVSGAYGQAVHASFTPADRLSLAPAADAYVRGGTYGGDNYGSAATLRLYESTNDNTKRQAYLKFDLSAFASISNATLQLYGSADAAATVRLYAVADDTWTETGLAYNNKPAGSGSPVASFSVTTSAQGFQLDLTALAQAELGGNGLLSLLAATPTSTALVDLNSKENTVSPPRLVVTGVRQE